MKRRFHSPFAIGWVLATLPALLLTAEPDHVPAFRTAILPILTKAGCNGGACHGAATGQAGFRLSLLGYDPEEDHERITRELGGRRIDRTQPDASLLLRKASGSIEHDGGKRLRTSSPEYQALREWIASGSPYGPRDLRVAAIEVTPPDLLFDQTGGRSNLTVIATFSDGTRHRVTDTALFTSNDETIAEVGRSGDVAGRSPGLTSIMVRYGGQVAAARVGVRFTPVPVPNRGGVSPGNFIDVHLDTELARLGLPLAPPASDEEFLRRSSLDLSGLLPAPEAVLAFTAEPDNPRKRAQWIDRQVHSPGFADVWTTFFADLLMIQGPGPGPVAFHQWLRAQVASNRAYDDWIRELLTASGRFDEVGPANFFQIANDPRDLAEQVSRILLGIQVGCARCHAHPTDRWTQDDHHRFAAFFARLDRSGGRLSVTPSGDVEHPKSHRPCPPRPLGEDSWRGTGTADRRVELATWVTAPGNPYFARALVNRVWERLMGPGLMTPTDDLRPTNPAVFPTLLEALTRDFVGHGFDVRHLVRTIALSDAYQRASRLPGAPEAARRLHALGAVRPLPAAVLADAVAELTGQPDHYDGFPVGTRAIQLPTPAVAAPTLDLLGRCQRKQSCAGATATGGGLALALDLIQGPAWQHKLDGPWLRAVVDKPPREIIQHLYLRAYSRPPSAGEVDAWTRLLETAPDRRHALQDLMWALLNSREFALNH